MNDEIPKLNVDDASSTSDLLYVSSLGNPDLEGAERRGTIAKALEKRAHPSAMLTSFGWLARLVARFLFAHVLLDQKEVDRIREESAKRNIVFVMQARSLLDYLYFNWAFEKAGLSLPRFANGVKVRFFQGVWTYLLSFFARKPKGPEEEIFHALLEHDHPCFLFLGQPRKRSSENEAFSQKFLFRVVRVAREIDPDIAIVPLVLVWERRPDEKHSTIVEEIFGSVQNPGFFRKFFHWFRTIWQSFLKFGQPVARISEPIQVQDLLAEVPQASTADAAELLRDSVTERIAGVRHVILGPVAEPRSTIWEEIRSRPQYAEAIALSAEQQGISDQEAEKLAHKQFLEIAADTSLMALKILSAILSLVWYRIYDGFEVDEKGLEHVKEVSKNSSVILIPSHKSHIDYLVISYLFYHNGMNNPLIAAGANLNFWPLGPIFRRAGAFFIRRTFKGDILYKTVFREYLTAILRRGHPVEFFIEGTRSRTGKLVKPKYGVLDMIAAAFASGRIDAVKLIPISVTYERVIESKSHRDEQLGGEKEKESLSGLLKTPQFLARKYGRTYVEFNEPIDLGSYLQQYGIDQAKNWEDNEDRGALIVRLAHRIIYDINEVTTVTPTAIAAMILLTHDSGGVGRARFLADIGFLLRFLSEPSRDVRLSRTLHDALEAALAKGDPDTSQERNPVLESLLGRAVSDLMDWAIQLFESSDHVKIESPKDREERYRVPDTARLELAYYRNTIVHHCVPEALLSAAICSFEGAEMPLAELKDRTLFLSRLFKHEWIYEERAEFENVFHRTLDYFVACGWAKQNEETVRVSTPRPDEILFFRQQVVNFVEAYHIVATNVRDLEPETLTKDFVARVLKKTKQQHKNDTISYESISKPTYQNAIHLLVDWKILERKDVEKRRGLLTLASDVDSVVEKLETYLASDERYGTPP